MLTIRFDDEDRRHAAPYFNLKSSHGQAISIRDYHEYSNLILLFLHAPNCPDCRAFLDLVASQAEDYVKENAQLAAIFPLSVEKLSSNSVKADLVYLADPGNSVRRSYAGLMAAGLVGEREALAFVLDSYGAPYACLKAPEPEDAFQDEILSWLRFINVQCPE